MLRPFVDNAKFIRNSLASLHQTLEPMITALDENLIEGTILEQFREIFEKTTGLTRDYANFLQKGGQG